MTLVTSRVRQSRGDTASAMESPQRRSYDHRLATYALRKIANAQERGSLGEDISINRLGKQILLDRLSEDDAAWVLAQFRDGTHQPQSNTWLDVTGKGANKKIWRKMHYTAPLRARIQTGERYRDRQDFPPTVEFTYLVPHECDRWTATAARRDGGRTVRTVWRCSASQCNKRLSRPQAVELGLDP